MSTGHILDIQIGSRLFCTAAPGLVSGDLLRPGDFRQRLMTKVLLQTEEEKLVIPDPGGAGVVMMELCWETVRLREFPHRPSRWDCHYLWQTEAEARDFFSRRPWPTGLYEVEIVEIEKIFKADMNLTSYFEEPETLASLIERAGRYWSTESKADDRGWEVLLEGSVRISRTLTQS